MLFRRLATAFVLCSGCSAGASADEAGGETCVGCTRPNGCEVTADCAGAAICEANLCTALDDTLACSVDLELAEPVLVVPDIGVDMGSVVPIDANMDASMDLLITDLTGGTWIALGPGTVAPMMISADGGTAVAGDVDADGFSDIVIATSQQGARSLHTFVGDGAGGFTEGVTSSIDAISFWDAVGTDFDGDGDLDIVHRETNGLHVLLGVGDGTFATGPALGEPTSPTLPPWALGDVNGDGATDLAGDFGAVQLWRGAAEPQFDDLGGATDDHEIAIAALGSGAGGTVVGTTAYGVGGIAVVWRNDGGGTVREADRYLLDFEGVPTITAVADLRGDGSPDVIVSAASGSFALGTRPGGLEQCSISLPKWPSTAADWDGDGAQELIALDRDGVWVMDPST